jgi:hypothetical protein
MACTRHPLVGHLATWAWMLVPAVIALLVAFHGSFPTLSAQNPPPQPERADPARFLPGSLDPAAVLAARSFNEFPIVWLGEEFQGLKLSAFIRENYSDKRPGYPRDLGKNTVSLIYVDCELQKTDERASCVARCRSSSGRQEPVLARMR